MGFFDALNTEEGRAGMAMLAAAGPQAQPMNFGQRMVMAQALQDAWGDGKQKRRMQDMQLKEAESQIRARDIAAQQAQGKMQFLSNLFTGPAGGGVAPSAPAGGSAAGGGAPSAPAGDMGRLASMTPEQIAQAKAMGFDFTELWEKARTGVKRDAGAYYQMQDGSTQHFPQMQPGVMMLNGGAQAIPGYAQATAGIDGAKAGAVKAAELPYALALEKGRGDIGAALDPMKVWNPQTQREEFVPRGQVARPQAAQNFTGSGYDGGSAAAAAPEQVRMIQSEMARLPNGHPDRAALSREIARLQGLDPRGAGNYAAGPSAAETVATEAERTRRVEQTKADIQPVRAVVAARDAANNAIDQIEAMFSHPGRGTATGLSGSLDPRNYIPGTDSTDFRTRLDQLKGGVFVQAYQQLKGGGAITEVEGRKAEQALARLSTAQSDREFETSLREYQDIVRRGVARLPDAGGATGSWEDQRQPAARREFSVLPSAAEFDGRRMRAPDGTVYRSRAGKWVKE